ncbi:MAG TPA: rubredoxin [Nitrospiria bacterium]|nr:rubredoxin [Nitrospiria bacterium]
MVWRCSRCGYTDLGEDPPEECPNCRAPKTEFEGVEED